MIQKIKIVVSWLLIASVITVTTAVMLRFYCNPLRNPFRTSMLDDSVEEGTWVGYTETRLRERLGEPTDVTESYRRVGPDDPPHLPPGPYRTLVYERPDGYLYIWLRDPGDGFVCFESLWFGHNVMF